MSLPLPQPLPLSPILSPGRPVVFKTEEWSISCQGKQPPLATLHVTQRLAINKQNQLPPGLQPITGITGGDVALNLVTARDKGMQDRVAVGISIKLKF